MALTPLSMEVLRKRTLTISGTTFDVTVPVPDVEIQVVTSATGAAATVYGRYNTLLPGPVTTDAAGRAQVWLPTDLYEWRAVEPGTGVAVTDWAAFSAYRPRGREGAWGSSPGLTGSPAVDTVTIPAADVEDVAYGLELMLNLAHDAMIDLRVELQQDSLLPLLLLAQGSFQWTRTLPSPPPGPQQVTVTIPTPPPTDPTYNYWRNYRIRHNTVDDYATSSLADTTWEIGATRTIGALWLVIPTAGAGLTTHDIIIPPGVNDTSLYFWVEYDNGDPGTPEVTHSASFQIDPGDQTFDVWKSFLIHYGSTNVYGSSTAIGSFSPTDASSNPAATTQGVTVSEQAFESNYFWVEYLNDGTYPAPDQLTAVEGSFQGGPTDRIYTFSPGCFRNQAFDGTVYLSSLSGTDDPFFTSSIVDGGHYGVGGLGNGSADLFNPLSGNWTLTITDYGDSGSLSLDAWRLTSLLT